MISIQGGIALQPVLDDETREVPLWLLEDIQQHITITNCLYCTDREDIVKKMERGLWFQLNETSLNDFLEKYIQ